MPSTDRGDSDIAIPGVAPLLPARRMMTTKTCLAPIGAALLRPIARAAMIAALACSPALAWSQAVTIERPRVEGVTATGPEVVPIVSPRDLRTLPPAKAKDATAARPYRPLLPPPPTTGKTIPSAPDSNSTPPSGSTAPMPAPSRNFAGMSYNDPCTGGVCGGGWPPDTNGDVGPDHYIQGVNDAYAIYSKSGVWLAWFTLNQLWSDIGTSPCNGNSQGDPVVLYDALADRWILTHLAFARSGKDRVPPFYQCFAVSRTGDPVAGGWYFYALQLDTGGSAPPPGTMNDYPKFGIWGDCLYMTANQYSQPSDTFVGASYASLNRADLYSGSSLRWGVGFINNARNPYTMIPSNLSGRAAFALPPGTPNYLVSESMTAYAYEVRKFTPGANCAGAGTLAAPVLVSQATYIPPGTNNIAQPNTSTKLDNLGERLMQKVQYRNVGGSESLWVVHSVQSSTTSTVRPQWAQIDVTGGVVATTPAQEQIYAPDDTLHRWAPSLAVDAQGNMAMGYSTSNGTSPNFPGIAYSGRLASDPLDTLPQTEVQLFAGSGSQANVCGGVACSRWGDYTAMSVDPSDDCTFWYTNQYYDSQVNGTAGNWQTRIGSFRFPSCRSPTTVALASSSNPATAGTAVTFTVTVTGIAPTGTVQFARSGTSIAGCSAVALSGTGNVRSASCSTGGLVVGVHSITASFGGDAMNAAATSNALSQVILVPFANLGFEVPNVAGSYRYAPAFATWVFNSSAGITGNGNAFTSGNAPAPEGVQVAFLQLAGSAAQTSDLGAGNYTVSLKAAQRGNWSSGTQSVKVLLDGTEIGQVTPAAATYAFYRTPSFSVASTGVHTLTLRGAGSGGTDFTAFVDDVRIEASGSFAPTSTTLASSLNPARFGTGVTFTATVNGAGPSGTVRFTAAGVPIAGCAAVPLAGSGNARTATCTAAELAVGAHSVTGAYSGDAANGASTSSTLWQTVDVATFTNLGFETPDLASSYQYAPTSATWVFTGASGITGNGNPFTGGNPNAPEGVGVAFIQNGGRIGQAGTIAAGQYVVSFRAAQRGNFQFGTQAIAVIFDGVTVGQFTPAGTSYTAYQTAAFIVASTGMHTLELVGIGGGGADFTAFVDDVYVGAPVVPFANLGFESPALAGSYLYAPAGVTWNFNGSAGITGNGNAFTSANPAAPEGAQVGFIQNFGRIGQEATLAAGRHAVTFRAAQRGSYAFGTQTIAVVVDGTTVGQFTPPYSAYAFYSTPAFDIASSGTHTLEFVGAGNGTDFTAFVDDVRIVVP